ncbi:SIR2 family protein [Herbaspirillum sp. NPDC101397]|uniref:SIR2 family protein n=1 Tax=Herbaspirillum sp. NPDC101397 TaxID=3364006 RepID=UPI003839F454
MAISIQQLIEEIVPERTVLVFGAGASVDSDAPSAAQLIELIGSEFGIRGESLTLAEVSGLAERKRSRVDLISCLRKAFKGVRAKGAILNLPLYNWKSIFTTNYDEVVEDAYKRKLKPLTVFSSNFDFTVHADPAAVKYLKLHGTIGKDIADGHVSRMIITDLDYDLTQDYREALYIRFSADLTDGSHIVIIGQSLADPDLREVIQKALAIHQKSMSGGRITLLLYTRDESRASLFEARGIRVVFGGVDDFFLALAKRNSSTVMAFEDTGDFLEHTPRLRPVTINVADEVDADKANLSAIFNGWPARYGDITRNFTFDRTVAAEIAEYLRSSDNLCALLLGASGVGKTTAARQAVIRLRNAQYLAWEHKSDHALIVDDWVSVATRLKNASKVGVLFIDDAHAHLMSVNDLVDALVGANIFSLKIILVSTRSHWNPRVKTPNIYLKGVERHLSQLSGAEIDRLLTLVETVPQVRSLVESGFGGFSRYEQRRRLLDRCEADMFVCLKNIFASEKFDDIILREFAGLDPDQQEIYKLVAAMEHAGIRVHRQLVMRLASISAHQVASSLQSLTDIIHEYGVNEKEGIYGWRVRHAVIASIVSRYKFSDVEKITELFTKVINQISPTYDIEIRTIRELCNIESGLAVIPDKHIQNTLLRRMMSIAPAERVPRHRLIRNLIEQGDFDQAESEIRIFEKDFRRDGPIVRYRILLMIARAIETPGLMREDREAILQQACDLAVVAVEQFESNKTVLSAYCELGVETYKLTGNAAVYDAAIEKLKKAEGRLADPEITKMVARFQRRITSQSMVQISQAE